MGAPTLETLQERVNALAVNLQEVQANVYTRASREALAAAFEQQSRLLSTAQVPSVEPTAVFRGFAELLMAAVEGTGCLTKSCTVEGTISKMKLDRIGAVTEFEVTVTAAGCGLAAGAKFTYTAPPPTLHADIKSWKRLGTKVSLKFDANCKIETVEEL
jgi:hypothetical protein